MKKKTKKKTNLKAEITPKINKLKTVKKFSTF